MRINLPRTFLEGCAFILNASGPEAVFGSLQPTKVAEPKVVISRIKKIYRILSKLVHPDTNPNAQVRAGEAFRRLMELKAEAEKRCGVSGNGNSAADPDSFKPVTFAVAGRTYTLTQRVKEGATCGIFEGVAQGKGSTAAHVLFRIPHNAADNDLMEREAGVLRLLAKKAKQIAVDPEGVALAEKFLMRIPPLLDSIRLTEPGVADQKVVNIFGCTAGFERGWFTLEEIRKAHPQGVNSRIMCFIMNRVLEGLTLAHMAGVVHCALTPNHILVHAESHLGNILDWTAACRTAEGDKVPYVDKERFEGYFPPEILDPAGTLSPATDIYMLACSMVYLLGGDPKEALIPNTVEGPLREFFNRCLQPKRKLRPNDAATAYGEFRQIIKALFGQRKFVELKMPGI